MKLEEKRRTIHSIWEHIFAQRFIDGARKDEVKWFGERISIAQLYKLRIYSMKYKHHS